MDQQTCPRKSTLPTTSARRKPHINVPLASCPPQDAATPTNTAPDPGVSDTAYSTRRGKQRCLRGPVEWPMSLKALPSTFCPGLAQTDTAVYHRVRLQRRSTFYAREDKYCLFDRVTSGGHAHQFRDFERQHYFENRLKHLRFFDVSIYPFSTTASIFWWQRLRLAISEVYTCRWRARDMSD